jgi:repressor LexA
MINKGSDSMTVGDKIKKKRIELGLSVDEVAKALGKNRATIYRYESHEIEKLPTTILEPLAKLFKVEPAELMGWDEKLSKKSEITVIPQEDIYQIPIYSSVSAGFGATASDYIIGYTPIYIKNPADARDTMCITVQGDSMYPKIEDGDLVQVLKCPSVDSGSIAVVLIDGEDGVVKKVVYGGGIKSKVCTFVCTKNKKRP